MSIGIINLDAFLNAELGTLVNTHAPSAINDAFRLYMLPQGVFSVAVATVLFPTLSRMASRRDPAGMRRTLGNGIRQINLLMIPSAGLMAVLATPDRPARLPARRFRGASTLLRLHGAAVVRLQPALRGRESAAQPDLLRPSAPLDPDHSWR